jgi:3-mercaptopyruvate sulfurtransferase SseA
VALQLHRLGITRVRPLEGGLEKWAELGFPVEKVKMADSAAV